MLLPSTGSCGLSPEPWVPSAGCTRIVLLMELSPNDWTLMSLNYFKGEVKRIIEVGTYDHKRNFLVLYHWMEKFSFHQRKN